MVSTCRSIARWLMHARKQVAILYDRIAHQRVAGIGLLQKRRSGSVAPKVLEPRRRQFRIAHGVLNVAVAQISVKRPRICLLLAEAKQQASETYRGSAMRAKPSGVGLLGPQRDTPMHFVQTVSASSKAAAYLKAVAALERDADGKTVVAKMKEISGSTAPSGTALDINRTQHPHSCPHPREDRFKVTFTCSRPRCLCVSELGAGEIMSARSDSPNSEQGGARPLGAGSTASTAVAFSIKRSSTAFVLWRGARNDAALCKSGEALCVPMWSG